MSKRIAALVVLPLFLAALAFSQSLTEAAKKEKERRESLKGRTVAVTTNADLGKVKKKPAVPLPAETPPPEGEREGQAAPGSARAETGEPPAAPPVQRYSAEPQTYGAPQPSQGNQADLESQWKRAKDYVELLDVRMLALRQQMDQAGNQPPKDQIQREMNALALKIQLALAEEKKAKDALDKASASQALKK